MKRVATLWCASMEHLLGGGGAVDALGHICLIDAILKLTPVNPVMLNDSPSLSPVDCSGV